MEKPFNKKWRRQSSQLLYTCDHFRVVEDNVLLPNGATAIFTYISRPPAIMIVPVVDEDHVLLVKQYRYLVGEDSWELPGGSVKPGETPFNAAGRELEEETGFHAGMLQLMNIMYTSNGSTDEVLHTYIARQLTSVAQKLEQTEADMVVRRFELSKCLEMVHDGTISCAETALGLMYFKKFIYAE